MRKQKKLSRPKRVLRNCLLTVVALILLWAAGGFDPLTKEMVVQETLRQNLLSDGEVIHETPRFLYIDCGDVILRTEYQWYGLCYQVSEADVLEKDRGIVLNGALWVFGDLENVASGVLEVPLAWKKITRQVSHTFTTEGVKESGHAMFFTLSAENEDQEWLLENLIRCYWNGTPRYPYTLRLYDETGGLIGTWTNAEKQEAT